MGQEIMDMKSEKQTEDIAAKTDQEVMGDGQRSAEKFDKPSTKRALSALGKEKSEMEFENLSEMLNVDQFLPLLVAFCESIGIAAAIIDLKGKVLAAARWQRACTDFHRTNVKTLARCIESDTELATRLNEGKPFSFYRCKNGLNDAASPVIVQGRHVANAFVGQFLTSPPDMEFFRLQAEECGLDTDRYLDAIREVPVVDETKLESILRFLKGMAQMMATLSMERQQAINAERLRGKEAEAAENARKEIEQYKANLELLVQQRTEELQKSEQRLDLALRGANTGLWDWNAVTGELITNDTWSEMLGYERAELDERYGNAYPRREQLTHPEDLPAALAALNDHMEGKTAEYRAEFRMKTSDGGWRWILDVGQALRDEKGKAMRLIGTHTDITDYKIMEQKIRAEGERLKQVFDTAPVCIAFWVEGKFEFANPLFVDTFGLDVGDAASEIYVNNEEREAVIEGLKREGIIKNLEIQMFNKQKAPRNILASFLPIDLKGQEGVLGWLTDITERKKAEKELHERMEELERFSRLTINREERMIELKEEINTLLEQTRREKKYKIVEEGDYNL